MFEILLVTGTLAALAALFGTIALCGRLQPPSGSA
jgi:hypothetical protein